jgi:Ion channel
MTATSTTHRRPGKRLVEALTSIDSYGAVLVSILVTYAMAVIVTGDQARSVVLFTQIATVWLVFRVAHSHPSVRRATDVLLLIAGVVAVLNGLALTGDEPGTFLFAASCVLYLVAPVAIVRDIGTRSEVDLETVLGAIAAYLLIGMFFAFAYRWMGDVESTPFFGAQGDGSLPDDLFFSFTTMTTIGFGSLVPADNPGQTFAVAEGVIGQLFLVVAVAKVIGSWQPKRMSGASPED